MCFSAPCFQDFIQPSGLNHSLAVSRFVLSGLVLGISVWLQFIFKCLDGQSQWWLTVRSKMAANVLVQKAVNLGGGGEAPTSSQMCTKGGRGEGCRISEFPFLLSLVCLFLYFGFAVEPIF